MLCVAAKMLIAAMHHIAADQHRDSGQHADKASQARHARNCNRVLFDACVLAKVFGRLNAFPLAFSNTARVVIRTVRCLILCLSRSDVPPKNPAEIDIHLLLTCSEARAAVNEKSCRGCTTLGVTFCLWPSVATPWLTLPTGVPRLNCMMTAHVRWATDSNLARLFKRAPTSVTLADTSANICKP